MAIVTSDLNLALRQAIYLKSSPEVIHFIKAGADVDFNHGSTNLHVAASMLNNNAVLRLLLEAGANPNQRTKQNLDSPLHSACFSGNIEGIKLLTKFGADVDLPDNKNRTPLVHGLSHPEIIPVLASLGANIEYVQWGTEKTLFEMAISSQWLEAALELARLGAGLAIDKLNSAEKEFHQFVVQQIKMERAAADIPLAINRKSVAL